MAFQVANNLRFRRSFGRIRKIIDLPYFIAIQKNSYDLFLQRDIPPTQRQNLGLQEVFKSVFPIKDFNETASLEFVSYAFFFFQAEDGIRDWSVTGVQTCALPI